jgi:cell division protein FtsB
MHEIRRQACPGESSALHIWGDAIINPVRIEVSCLVRGECWRESVSGERYDRNMGATISSQPSKGAFASLGQLISNAYSVRRRIATVAAAVLALGVGYHVVFGPNGLIVYQQKRLDARTLDGELHTLQVENDRLKGHVERLQNDPNAIEHQAREELHYTRPGEVIYTLPPSPTKK